MINVRSEDNSILRSVSFEIVNMARARASFSRPGNPDDQPSPSASTSFLRRELNPINDRSVDHQP